MPSDMSLSGIGSKKRITNDTQHAHDEQSDKAICAPPKRRYATRSATKSENPTTDKSGDLHSSSPGELNQLSKHLKSNKSLNSKLKNSTTCLSSPCELSQASDSQCAGTSRTLTTKKSTVQASLPGLLGRVSKDQHKSQDATPKKSVTPKKRVVSASSQSSQLSLHHSKKTKDLKAEDQPSTIPCLSSKETSQFSDETKDSKFGNKTTISSQEPSQPSKDHLPKKTKNIAKHKKNEIPTPTSKPSKVQLALGSKHSESKKIVINTRSLGKSIKPPKHQPAMRIYKDSALKNNENVTLSLGKSNLVSESELTDQKGKAKLLEEPPKQSYNKEPRAQYFITWDGFEEPELEPCGLHCFLCSEDLAYSLDDAENDKALLPEVSVLACGHAFHSICLSLHTSEEQSSREPKCLACLCLP